MNVAVLPTRTCSFFSPFFQGLPEGLQEGHQRRQECCLLVRPQQWARARRWHHRDYVSTACSGVDTPTPAEMAGPACLASGAEAQSGSSENDDNKGQGGTGLPPASACFHQP